MNTNKIYGEEKYDRTGNASEICGTSPESLQSMWASQGLYAPLWAVSDMFSHAGQRRKSSRGNKIQLVGSPAYRLLCVRHDQPVDITVEGEIE